MSSITILTPTYNRAAYLPKLYESLVQQTNRDFIWMVIDDGSEDDTEHLVAGWKQEQTVEIVYEKQQNGGKHRALNRGIARITSELTFIVDSDDYLPEDAIATIIRYHNQYKNQRKEQNLCGYSFLRCHQDGSVNTAYFPEDGMIGTYREVRINGGIGGDKAEVFYTDILQQFPFPEFAGEKFMPEDVVWMQMSGPYQMVHINVNVYTCDYLEGGLTTTGHRMKIHSPKGMVLRSKIYLEDAQVKWKVKVKMMLLYIIYGKFAGYSMQQLRKESGKSGLWTCCYVPACFFYHRWKKEA